ncbi:MAG: hypothetical protein ACI9VS_001744 [Candidatus Binatia bacterium]
MRASEFSAVVVILRGALNAFNHQSRVGQGGHLIKDVEISLTDRRAIVARTGSEANDGLASLRDAIVCVCNRGVAALNPRLMAEKPPACR